MRDIIKKIFEDVLIETEKKDNVHFIGSGFLPPEDPDVVFAHRQTLPEKNYQQLLDDVGKLLNDILRRAFKGKQPKP